jgi:hypothetical protein
VSVEELGLLMTGGSTDMDDADAEAGPAPQAGPDGADGSLAAAGPLDLAGGTIGVENPGSTVAEAGPPSPEGQAGDTGQPDRQEPS